MQSKTGEVYTGVINGITSFGIYVELPNTVEGLIHISRLNDYYIYNEDEHELVGERMGIRYVLGQSIKVKVESVDKINRTIEFVMA